jgi:hypothetical protein
LLPARQQAGGLALRFEELILPRSIYQEPFCPSHFAPSGQPGINSVFRFGISKVDFCPSPNALGHFCHADLPWLVSVGPKQAIPCVLRPFEAGAWLGVHPAACLRLNRKRRRHFKLGHFTGRILP